MSNHGRDEEVEPAKNKEGKKIMKGKTFEEYMKENNEELAPWQKEAADALLAVMQKQGKGATGKTFLLRHLTEFVNLHGNEFEV